MYVVSFLALAVQVAVPPAYDGNDDGRLYLWIALAVGVLALGAALMLAAYAAPTFAAATWLPTCHFSSTTRRGSKRLDRYARCQAIPPVGCG